jgi:hypothetical protein
MSKRRAKIYNDAVVCNYSKNRKFLLKSVPIGIVLEFTTTEHKDSACQHLIIKDKINVNSICIGYEAAYQLHVYLGKLLNNLEKKSTFLIEKNDK